MSDWNASDWVSEAQMVSTHSIRNRLEKHTLRGTTKLMGSIMLPTALKARAISFSLTFRARGGRKHMPLCGWGLVNSVLSDGSVSKGGKASASWTDR